MRCCNMAMYVETYALPRRRAFTLSKQNPTYYAIITADVRYDNDLPPNAKLLFGEITALANATGICTASNGYFAKLYDVKPTTVSEWVSLLRDKGYVQVNILAEVGNRREIKLPIVIKPNTYSENPEDPSSGKAEDNNTSINNKAHTPEREAFIKQVYELYLRYFIVKDPTEGAKLTDEQLDAAQKRYKLTPKREAAIVRRFEDAGAKMLKGAIIGFARADWSNGNNDRNWKADLADFICRSYENVERGARLYEDQVRGGTGEDAWSKL